jgi:hypothetical protein
VLVVMMATDGNFSMKKQTHKQTPTGHPNIVLLHILLLVNTITRNHQRPSHSNIRVFDFFWKYSTGLV